MRKIAILTDSACDIPVELEKKHNIDIMSFCITVDGESYFERKDFTFEEFYNIARNAEGVPSTAHITSIQFCEKYSEYAAKGYTDVLHIPICRAGSATFDASILGEQQFREEMPDSKMKIHRVDSHTYSMVYGYFVVEAAKKLENGAEIAEVVRYLNDIFSRTEAVLSAFTLKFIKKSGRVSAAAAFAGELLGLKPVISLIDGESTVQNKVRGDSAVMPALVKYAKEHMDAENPFYMVATTDDANGKELAKLCKKEFGYEAACIFKLGAAITINTGPEAVALVYFGPKRDR